MVIFNEDLFSILSSKLPKISQEELRTATTIDQWIKRSLQECSAEDCKLRLEALISSSSLKSSNTNSKQVQKYKALAAVLQHMLVPRKSFVIDDNYSKTSRGFIHFRDAFEIFISHQDGHTTEKTFRDNLLHDSYGLPIIIVQMPSPPFDRYIVLKSADIDVIDLYRTFTKKDPETKLSETQISPENVNMIIQSMDTEFDRSCARLLFSCGRTLNDLQKYHISSYGVHTSKECILAQAEEMQNARLAATDMVNLRLNDKQERIQNQIDEKETLIKSKEDHWPEATIGDMRSEVTELKERLVEARKVQVNKFVFIYVKIPEFCH